MKHVQAPGLALCASALAACAPTLGLQARYGTFDVDGDVGIASGSVTSDNSVDAMGIEEDDSVPSVRGDFQWGTPHLTVTLQESTHDGDGRLEAEISEGGVTIPAGSRVSTDLDLGLHTAYLTFDLIPGDWELGVGVGVVAIDLDLATTDELGNTVTTDELLPVPVIAARVHGELGPVAVEALAGGMTYSEGDDEITFLDLDANGSLRILGSGDRATGWLTLGLRYADIDAEYADGGEEVTADLQLTGPYLGLRLAF